MRAEKIKPSSHSILGTIRVNDLLSGCSLKHIGTSLCKCAEQWMKGRRDLANKSETELPGSSRSHDCLAFSTVILNMNVVTILGFY